MIQDTLLHRIVKKQALSQQEIESAVYVLGSGCRKETKRKLALVLNCVPDIRACGIYGRVFLEDGKVSYCPGQSYMDEIRTVRNLLLGRV
jgi:flavin-dependent dehydrogenase